MNVSPKKQTKKQHQRKRAKKDNKNKKRVKESERGQRKIDFIYRPFVAK